MTFTDPFFPSTVDSAPRTIGARTLAAIRWVALAGQVATLLVVRGGMPSLGIHNALSSSWSLRAVCGHC